MEFFFEENLVAVKQEEEIILGLLIDKRNLIDSSTFGCVNTIELLTNLHRNLLDYSTGDRRYILSNCKLFWSFEGHPTVVQLLSCHAVTVRG